MHLPDEETRQFSLESMRSAIRKTRQALTKMQEKEASISLVEKRLSALETGLYCLERQWYGTPCEISPALLNSSSEVLSSILASVDKELGKTRPVSSQKTLLERRSLALQQSLEALKCCLEEIQ